MMNVLDFKTRKKECRKISMVTCYDYCSAQIINRTDIDLILVGDSLAMVMHGHDSTLPADTELIALHSRAVRRGAPTKFIVADMPFLEHRKGKLHAMNAVERIMKTGVNAIKLEGVSGHEDTIEHIVESGVPVMGHLGLTPQSVHQLGGHKVQGRQDEAKIRILKEAKKLEELGCFAIVLECMSLEVAGIITKEISIPTIGIGAGSDVDGQVLVLQDLLGMNGDFNPKFLRKYLNGQELITRSLNQFHEDVVSRSFPALQESYL